MTAMQIRVNVGRSTERDRFNAMAVNVAISTENMALGTRDPVKNCKGNGRARYKKQKAFKSSRLEYRFFHGSLLPLHNTTISG